MAESSARVRTVPPIIDMTGLVRVYRMGSHEVRAVDDVRLVVERGEFLAVMGASGSGKSTLLNLMGCLDTPSSGRYVLRGQTVTSMDDDALAAARNREIGFVFQSFNLLERLTALQNVELPLIYARVAPRERLRAAAEMLALVGLADRADHRPNQLSGGQRQRVAIARALVHRPALLLADEPTGNLDSESSAEIMKLFGELHAQGNTIVMVTHDREIAAAAERTIRMRDGKIVEDTHA
ncbi:MAG: ABC transporter ATP-binding protein [Acidobacteria bacterium]|nr:MAG: ABC transporter ATP-binding protein [Acidobacteriota bacterium]